MCSTLACRLTSLPKSVLAIPFSYIGTKKAVIVGLNFAKQTVILGFNFNKSDSSLTLLLLI